MHLFFYYCRTFTWSRVDVFLGAEKGSFGVAPQPLTTILPFPCTVTLAWKADGHAEPGRALGAVYPPPTPCRLPSQHDADPHCCRVCAQHAARFFAHTQGAPGPGRFPAVPVPSPHAHVNVRCACVCVQERDQGVGAAGPVGRALARARGGRRRQCAEARPQKEDPHGA